MAVTELDCVGLKCPMPIVKISQAVKNLNPGDQLQVTASDPAFEADVQAWHRKTGNEISEISTQDGKSSVTITKV